MFWEQVSAAYQEDPGRGYVLASLVEKSGSSYLQPGARMIVRDDGYFQGSISAGCLEQTIADAAKGCLKNGRSRILEIDTRPFFGCFGKITVLLELMTVGPDREQFFHALNARLEKRSHFTVYTAWSEPDRLPLTGFEPVNNGDKVLVEQVNPKPRILVFGDWPDGQAVAEIARLMDWDVLSFDISGPGFSMENLLVDILPDEMTAAVVMGHNFARDILCLRYLLKSDYGYVGMIGSRKRREEVVNELVNDEDPELLEGVENLYCPAGLDLGGDGHQSIALSVLAEIHASLHNRSAESLRNKNKPVHAGSLAR